MFKRNFFKILAIVFFLLSGTSFYNSNKTPVKQIIVNKQAANKIISPTPLRPTGFAGQAPTSIPTEKITQIIILPTNTPAPQSSEVAQDKTTNPPQQDTITLEINSPDGNNKFTLTYKDDTNPCSILNDAKNEGKIKSVTIIHYGPPLNSDYVKEINGFSDNWNFAIDGSGKPTGCSNYKLNKNSTVTWKYN